MHRDGRYHAQAQVVPIGPPAPAEPGLPPTASPLPLVVVPAFALWAFRSAMTLRRQIGQSLS